MATRTDEHKFGIEFLEDILTWIQTHLSPEEVFTDDQLNEWAEKNGLVKED